MKTLLAQDVAFAFDDATAPLFSNINFSFSSQTHVIVGRNGVGKSIFLRLLAGKLAPTSGKIITNFTQIGYLSQHANSQMGTVADVMQLTLLRNAYKSICLGKGSNSDFAMLDGQWDFEDIALHILDHVQLPKQLLDATFKQLSGGQQTKVRLASLLLQNCELLLLDEPSNHLDTSMRKWLTNFLPTIPSIIVTHDTRLLNIADTISELTPSTMITSLGGWADYQASRAIQQDSLNKQIAQYKSEIRQAKKQQQADRERQERQQNHAKKSRIKTNQTKIVLDFRANQSQNTTSRLSKLHKQRIDNQHNNLTQAQHQLEKISPLAMTPNKPKKVSDPLLQISNMVLPFGTKKPINLLLNTGMRLAITGVNGTGKSTLLRVLTGELTAKSGNFHMTESHRLLDQHLSLLDSHSSALENFQQLSPSDWKDSDYRTILAQLRLRGDKACLPINKLSGGERLKVALACVFLGQYAPALLLLDEPDNHLDLESKLLLANTLAQYRGAVLMISHDENFMTNACTDEKFIL